MPHFETNGATIHYLEAGEGPPVVFLHGLGSRAADWQPQLEHFSKRYRCIAPDTRGSGESRDLARPGGPFTLAQFAADVAALLKHLNATPAHLVGLSMGGMIAFQLAVDHPELVKTLTIVNSGPAVVATNLGEHAALALRKLIARYLGPVAMAKRLAPRLFPKPEHAELRARFIADFAKNDRAAYLATTLAIVGWSVEDRIGEIAAPTLVLASDQDYTPPARKEAYARKMKSAEVVVVPDSRHAFPVEDPARFIALLEAFLARH